MFMEKILLNDYSTNESLEMIKSAMEKDDYTRFLIKCKNCSLSIAAYKGRYNGIVEVALRNMDDTDCVKVVLHDNSFAMENAIIRNIPIVLLIAMIHQFKDMDVENLNDAWNAYDTLACI